MKRRGEGWWGRGVISLSFRVNPQFSNFTFKFRVERVKVLHCDQFNELRTFGVKGVDFHPDYSQE